MNNAQNTPPLIILLTFIIFIDVTQYLLVYTNVHKSDVRDSAPTCTGPLFLYVPSDTIKLLPSFHCSFVLRQCTLDAIKILSESDMRCTVNNWGAMRNEKGMKSRSRFLHWWKRMQLDRSQSDSTCQLQIDKPLLSLELISSSAISSPLLVTHFVGMFIYLTVHYHKSKLFSSINIGGLRQQKWMVFFVIYS